MYKFYKLNRFSEDLDFSATNDFDIENLLKVIKTNIDKFDISTDNIENKKVYNSFLIKMSLRGVLFTGSKQTNCSIRLDIDKKSEVYSTTILTLASIYPDIPTFQALIMSEKEILTEKIRAIFKRNYARDVYDLWFLIKKNTPLDKEMLDKKLKYYETKFSKAQFIKKVNQKKELWNVELKPLIKSLPDFKTVKNEIENYMGIYKI